MSVLESRVYKIKPVYRADFRDLIERHAQFGGGSKDDKFVEGRSFSSVYEFYIYAFFLGLQTSSMVPIISTDDASSFMEIEHWKPRSLVDYLLPCAIARTDIDMFELQNLNEADVVSKVKNIKYTIESYANGGFKYIQDLLIDDLDLIDDDMFFVSLLSKK